jgi:histidinol-phosphate aminotransferase
MKKYLTDMKIYAVGEASVAGQQTVINLASNENTMPPATHILAALTKGAQELNRYADNTCGMVIKALSAAYDMPQENLICGNGSAELIFLLATAYAAEADEVIIWKHGYLLYETAVRRTGAIVVRPQSAAFVDCDALLRAVTDKTRLVFLDNPNNPTGAYITEPELRQIRAGLRNDILLVIDSAYAEYTVAENYADGAALVKEFDNVCMLRSFSKYYGLAGARVGWMYGPREIVALLRAIQQPASVSTVAQYAAVAALENREYLADLRQNNLRLRNQFREEASALGLKTYPSEANFVLVNFFSETIARAVFNELKNHGIIVRPMTAYHLGNCLRFTIGTAAEMRALKIALPLALTEACAIIGKSMESLPI